MSDPMAVKAAFEKVVAGIQANADSAKVTLTTRVESKGGMECEVKVRQIAPLTVDEPPAFGGTNQGMNPVELALSALAACQTLSLTAAAAVRGIPLDSVRVRARGHMDLRGFLGLNAEMRPGCERIELFSEIGTVADETAIRELVAFVESGCPVLDMLTRPVQVKSAVSLNGQALEGSS